MRDPGPDDGMTRRDFLRTAGAALAGATVTSTAFAAPETAASSAASSDASAPQALASVILDVNGEKRAVEIEPRTTLAEVLRGPLDLTGTKIGCDRGACSACTVWIDGAPVLSCMTLAIEVGGRKVTTIEGLARGERLHPVQEQFIAHDAIQCGFCTPGMVMSCAALVENNPAASAEDVKAAIAGHVCRCGTYPHAVQATLAAAKALRG